MDVINNAFGQTVDLFRSMTMGARMIAGLLLAAIVVSLVYLFGYQVERGGEYLLGGNVLSQSEIVAMEAAFGEAGLSDYEIVGNRVRVPRSQRASYLAALNKAGALPQSFGSATERMFQSDSPFDTRDIREHKARFAMESELAFTLSKLKGIEAAKVVINEQAAGAFGAKKQRQALVSVKPLGSKLLDEESVRTIRYTVASGAGVDPESVTVTDLNGQIHPGTGKEGGVNEFQNVYAAYQRQYINAYKEIIEDRLAIYPGIKVAVSVELDKDLQNQTSTLKYDDKPTMVRTKEETKESKSNSDDPGGRPGAIPNAAPNNPAQVASTSSDTSSNENRNDNQGVVGATQTTTQKAPLSPQRVSASIGVPRGLFVKIWQAKNPTPAGQQPKAPPPDELKQIELEKIREIEDAVVTLLPVPPKGDDLYKPVRVSAFDEPPTEVISPPTLADNAMYWLGENWQSLGLFGLACFGVVFLRGMIRSSQAQSPTPAAGRESHSQHGEVAAAIGGESHGEETSPEEAADAVNSLKQKFKGGGRSLREELAELVRDNPDAAANVLKMWISDAA